MSMIAIKDLHKFYGEGSGRAEVLKGITCDIEEGEICVLLGPSGSGKSTVLNAIGGIEPIDAGDVVVGGTSLSSLSSKALSLYRRDSLGFVFQFYNLVPNLTAKENIEVGAYLSKNPLPLDNLLHTLGLWEHRNKLPSQLSGGQQQRCSIGRALIKNPLVLLCDEPTGALDYNTSKEILSLIESVNQQFHTTVILVTHNEAIKGIAHRVMKLRDGLITENTCNDNRIPAHDLIW